MTFADADVMANQTVSIGGLFLSGADSGNAYRPNRRQRLGFPQRGHRNRDYGLRQRHTPPSATPAIAALGVGYVINPDVVTLITGAPSALPLLPMPMPLMTRRRQSVVFSLGVESDAGKPH